MKNRKLRKGLSVLLAAAVLAAGLVFSPAAAAKAEAKPKTAAKVSVTVKIGSETVNRKTVTVNAGGSRKVTVSATPRSRGLKTQYRSGNKNVATVSGSGVLKAKKAGTAKITVAVSGKNVKTAKTWFRVKVPAGKGGSAQAPGKTGSSGQKEKPSLPAGAHTCTISVDCITLAEHPEKLQDSEKRSFVPKDGWLLRSVRVEYEPGDSVYDVLYDACREAGYQIEASYTPMYGSYYIEGINQLYEFDGGPLSGWMYSVNGKFPNYGCSSCKVSDGDAIRFRYTLDLGRDIGGSNGLS